MSIYNSVDIVYMTAAWSHIRQIDTISYFDISFKYLNYLQTRFLPMDLNIFVKPLDGFPCSKLYGIISICSCAASWQFADLTHMGLPMFTHLMHMGFDRLDHIPLITLLDGFSPFEILWNCLFV